METPSKTCPDCGRTFTKAAHLVRHRMTHDQQRPFRCSVCGKAFARPDALQRHARALHGKRQRTESEAEQDSADLSPPVLSADPADIGSFGIPPLFPLQAFANTSTPNTQSLDEMVAGWLSQEGGALATEDALAAAFSNQAHWEPDLGDTFYAEPQETFRPEPRRSIMSADTWESGISNPLHHDTSRPASPPPRAITSPEEVVAELHVHHTVSTLHSTAPG